MTSHSPTTPTQHDHYTAALLEELQQKTLLIEQLEAKVLQLQRKLHKQTLAATLNELPVVSKSEEISTSMELPSVSSSLVDVGRAGINSARGHILHRGGTPPSVIIPRIALSPENSLGDITLIENNRAEEKSARGADPESGSITSRLWMKLPLKKVLSSPGFLGGGEPKSSRSKLLTEITLLRKEEPSDSVSDSESDSTEDYYDAEIENFWGMQVPVISMVYEGRLEQERMKRKQQRIQTPKSSEVTDESWIQTGTRTDDDALSSTKDDLTRDTDDADDTTRKDRSQQQQLDIQKFYASDYLTIDNSENYVPDTVDNIEYTDHPDQKKEIKCATVQKLIEKLTVDKQFDNQYLQAFLITYRSFTTPHELLDRLIYRYNITPLNGEQITAEEFKQWKQEVLDPVRLRVSQVIKTWITHHKYDFEGDADLCSKVNKLVDMMETTNGDAYARQLRQAMSKHGCFSSGIPIATRPRGKSTVNEAEIPKIKYPKNFKKYLNALDNQASLESVPLLDWPLLEIARQLTLIEYGIFSKIEPKECLNQNWQPGNNQEEAPHIFQMIMWFNRVSLYIATCIVTCHVAKNRVKMIEKAIKLAEECRKLKNYNAVFEVVSGLQNASVHRLKADWAKVKTTHRKTLESLLLLVSRDGNYRTLRSVVAHVEPPACPYLGLYLTDLTFVDDGNADLLNNKINFLKRRKLAILIRDLQVYHQMPYKLHEVQQVKDKWLKIAPLTESELYQRSLAVCPRSK